MNETVLPEVTTIRFVCGESSIEVIGPGNVMLVVSVRVRRSHHLHGEGARSTFQVRRERRKGSRSLDYPVLSRGYARMVAHPNDALDGALMRERTGALEEEVRLGVGAAEIEHAHLLLLAASEKVRRARGHGNAPDDVIVREGLETFAGVRVPDFADQDGERQSGTGFGRCE